MRQGPEMVSLIAFHYWSPSLYTKSKVLFERFYYKHMNGVKLFRSHNVCLCKIQPDSICNDCIENSAIGAGCYAAFCPQPRVFLKSKEFIFTILDPGL